MNSIPNINFVIALSAEAHPVIGYFKLKRNHDISAFEVYQNGNIRLIVSGIGKGNAACATGYLAGLSDPSVTQAWINIGIAGGDVANFGDMIIANSILDLETGQKYFPTLCFEQQLVQAEIVTVNEPSDRYTEYSLYDMEASAYFAAASKFSSSELVHSCKIITDNSETEIGRVDKELAIKVVQDRLDSISDLLEKIQSVASQLQSDNRVELAMKLLMEKYHFTESHKNSLRLNLQNWFALNRGSEIDDINLNGPQNAREYLDSLTKLIDSVSVSY